MKTINEYTVDELVSIVTDVFLSMEEKHLVRVGIFGSCARGEQTKYSDIDIVAEFKELITFEDLLKRYETEDMLKEKLGNILNVKVDLIYWDDRNYADTAFKNNIEREVVWLRMH